MQKVYLIYGISDCPACLHAQAFLMARDLEYVFIQADFSSAYRRAIKEELGWSTFPIIVVANDDGETLIGGYDDLIYTLEKESTTPT